MIGMLVKTPNDKWCIVNTECEYKSVGLQPDVERFLNIARNNKETDKLLMSMPFIEYSIVHYTSVIGPSRYADITKFINQLKQN